MEILIKVIQFVLSLSILIVFHEMGHFFFAKLFKTRVEKFYLFFNPWFSLFKFKKGETEYGVGWLPLGGYVKISGMIDESMDKEQMKQPAQPHEFRSKKTWQRLLIMLGGVLVNFILAFVIYIGVLFAWGEQYLPNQNAKYGIMVDSLAYKSGLRNGDKILSVDNKVVENFHKVTSEIVFNNAKTVQVLRGEQKIDVALPDTLIRSMIKTKDPEFISARIPVVVNDFTKESAAKKAGIKKGDKIVGINNDTINFYDEFRTKLAIHKNDSIVVKVARKGIFVDVPMVIPSTGLLGISIDGDLSHFFELKSINYSFFTAIPAGITKGFSTIEMYLKQFKLIFSSKVKGYESLGGFMTIGSIFPGYWDWEAFWGLTAFLSIILAIMNVLPIPALDGGHVLFLLYEMITGRKPSDKFLEYAQITGMILLFALLLYANANDVVRFFFK
jgi:regulator of sigma E protease